MRKANILVTFDVDSTLLSLESLDAVLQKALEMQQNKKLAQESLKKVHEITQQGMNGELLLMESIQQRLSIAQLNNHLIAQAVAKLQQNAISPGFSAILSKLRQFPGVAVHAISGGFAEIITPLLTGEMGLLADEIHANHLVFDPSEGGRAKLDAKNSVLTCCPMPRLSASRSCASIWAPAGRCILATASPMRGLPSRARPMKPGAFSSTQIGQKRCESSFPGALKTAPRWKQRY